MKELMKTQFSLWAAAGAAWALLAQPAAGAVSVYGEASSTGPTITVNLYADLPSDALLSFGVSLSYPAADVTVLSAVKNAAVWYLAADGKQYSYIDPDTTTPGKVVILGAKLDGANPLQGVSGTHVLLGTVTFGRLSRATPAFTVGLGRPAPFSNFVTTNSVVLDTMPSSLTFNSVAPDPNDTTLAGLPDAWQLKYFGSVGVAFWSDDPDQDGFNNRQEYLADTIPTNSASFLAMKNVIRGPGGDLVQWQGGVEATQVLQHRFSLSPTESWVDVFTNLPPTSVNASHFVPAIANTEGYYRVRALR
jgi:hypothetical protein